MKCINCYNEINDNLKFCPKCGTKQPANREAYELEHTELATAVPQQEQEEEEELSQAQIDEMIKAAEAEAKAKAEAQAKARAEEEKKAKAEAAKQVQAHQEKAGKGPEMTRFQLLQALNNDPNKHNIIQIIDEGILDYGFQDENATRAWYAVCAHLLSNQQGFHSQLTTHLSQSYEKAKSFFFDHALKEFDKRGLVIPAATQPGSDNNDSAFPAPVIPKVIPTLFQPETNEQTQYQASEPLPSPSQEETVAMSSLQQDSSDRGIEEESVNDESPGPFLFSKTLLVLLFSVALFMSFVLSLTELSEGLISDLFVIFLFGVLPLAVIIASVICLLKHHKTFKNEISDNNELFHAVKQGTTRTLAINVVTIFFGTIKFFFICTAEYYGFNIPFWLFYGALVIALLVLSFKLMYFNVPSDNVHDFLLSKTKLFTYCHILTIVIPILHILADAFEWFFIFNEDIFL